MVSMQSNGSLLSEKKIEELEEAGLDRINLSIHSLQPEKAAFLSGSSCFDIETIKGNSEADRQSNIDLLIAAGIYSRHRIDQDIPELIRFALDVGAGKRWPPLGNSEVRALPAGQESGKGPGSELVAFL